MQKNRAREGHFQLPPTIPGTTLLLQYQAAQWKSTFTIIRKRE